MLLMKKPTLRVLAVSGVLTIAGCEVKAKLYEEQGPTVTHIPDGSVESSTGRKAIGSVEVQEDEKPPVRGALVEQ